MGCLCWCAFLVGIGRENAGQDKSTVGRGEDGSSVWCNMDISPLPRVMDFIDILVTKKINNNNNKNYGAEAVVTRDH